MSEEILDTIERNDKLMPITVRQAGIRGAVLGLIALAIIFISVFYIGFDIGISDNTKLALGIGFVLISTMLVSISYARRGKNRHRLQYTLAVAYISILPPALLAAWIYSRIMSINIGDHWYEVIGMFIALIIFLLIPLTIVSILAIFIWLIFGKIE